MEDVWSRQLLTCLTEFAVTNKKIKKNSKKRIITYVIYKI